MAKEQNLGERYLRILCTIIEHFLLSLKLFQNKMSKHKSNGGEKRWMANNHIKRCSISLAIRKYANLNHNEIPLNAYYNGKM